MRLLITGGGTGGHVYPALAVVEALFAQEKYATTVADIVWVGSSQSIEERILAREGVPFRAISAGPLRGANPVKKIGSLARQVGGLFASLRLLRAWRPEVVLATGGYVSVPVVLAARLLGRPVLVYLPDMEPGLAVKHLARIAQQVAVSFEEVRSFFPAGKTLVSGYPVRRALLAGSKVEARKALTLRSEKPVVLVFGGSRAAHTLNEAVRGAIEPLLEMAQVLHICGPEEYGAFESLRASLPERLREDYRLYAYLYEQMTDALLAADLVVARAGAATLGEFPAVGLPAVLVPYPYAGQHQGVNAGYLAQHGAAVVVADAALGQRLLALVSELLGDPQRLAAMRAAAREMSAPEAANRLADVLFALAGGGRNAG
ncbi:MAG: undecaprenyldiphospho-muramoylpentapeptide beta-N-acetylglucosaminyltransferase [Anaerolineae bacterium]